MTIEKRFDPNTMTANRARKRLIENLSASGIHDEKVMMALSQVPRHFFLPNALSYRAYENIALPIGFNQTISQPYIVALMSQLLISDSLRPLNKVLEIGTGCGYQTAVLSYLCVHVYSVERIAQLLWDARNRLYDLKIKNVSMKVADGYQGWSQEAEFDGILVACAAEEIPQTLLQQLAPGGRLVMPIGNENNQILKVATRIDQTIEVQDVSTVRFVKFKRGVIKH